LDVLGLKEFSFNGAWSAFASDGMTGDEELVTHDDIKHGESPAAWRNIHSLVSGRFFGEVLAVNAERRSGEWFGWGHIVRDFQDVRLRM
jgi:hypothetical protein